MIISMKFDIVALTLAFVVFTASAQPQTITLHTDGCGDGAEQYMTMSTDNACTGQCYDPGTGPYTAISIGSSDSLGETTCYAWESGQCGDPGTSIAIAHSNTCSLMPQGINGFQCFTGKCGNR